ncbi:MAG TPA: CHAT domain-containing protein [Vicinamibacterales bacterium]|nr:CHAT domain-containing protein [Vicinamibacterales bacterium]
MSRVAPRAGVFAVHRRPGVAASAAIAGVVFAVITTGSPVVRAQPQAAPQAAPAPRTLEQLSDEINKLRAAGRFRDAVPLYEQAVALAEKDPASAAQLPGILSGQGLNLFQAGQFAAALQPLQRALEHQERATGRESAQVASILTVLGNVRRGLGDPAEAERSLAGAVAIYEKVAAGQPALAGAQANLASLYVAMGDYSRAQPLFEKAIAVYKAPGREPTIALAGTLSGLAQLHQNQGNLTAARPLLEESLAVRERVRPAGHPDRTTGMVQLAANLQESGDLAAADAMYEKALAEYGTAKLQDSLDAATVSINRAMLRLLLGDRATAESLYHRGLGIRETMLGASHPLTGEALQRLAVFYQVAADGPKALAAMSRSVAIAERGLGLTIASGSEAQKISYMRTVQENTDIALSMRLEFGNENPEWTTLAATAILQRKGRVLDAVVNSTALLRANLAEADRASFDALAKARSSLAQVVLNPAGLAPAARDARIAELGAETDRLERELAGKSAAARAELSPTTLADVRAGLPAGHAVVEYVKYLPFDPRTADRARRFGAPRYAAFVVRADKELAWIELGDAAPIEAAINTWRPTLRAARDTTVRTTGRAVYDLLVQPIEAAIAGAVHVYVVPDDVLNLLPFAAMTAADGRYLVERLSLSYLASSRDVLRFAATAAPQATALVIAAPQFASATAAPGAMSFSPLPGTAREGNAIAKLVPSAKVISGAAATEAAVKAVHGPEVLHFATHAFVVGATDAKGGVAGARGGDDRGLTPVVRITNDPAPLARAAIALAGAGAAPAAGAEDGLLTALEAANLDLRGTRLVVLSACETGLGEVRAGDGVYGFRRALTIAGAATQVLTLWKVDDAGTADLVTGYYQGLSKGEGRAAALRSAQLQTLKRADRSHPYYWSALVVAGNTAPMSFERR